MFLVYGYFFLVNGKLFMERRGGDRGQGEGWRGERRGGELKCYTQTDIQTYIQTYRHTDPPTKRVLEEHSLLKIIRQVSLLSITQLCFHLQKTHCAKNHKIVYLIVCNFFYFITIKASKFIVIIYKLQKKEVQKVKTSQKTIQILSRFSPLHT